jgi:hypothetical protein
MMTAATCSRAWKTERRLLDRRRNLGIYRKTVGALNLAANSCD